MIKVSKVLVPILTALALVLLAGSAAAAFGFSFPFGTIVAGPGLASAGPTTFNTYFHDGTMANAVASADAAVNGFSPVPGVLPGIPWGCGPCGYGYGPYGVANAANQLAQSACGTDNTLATSFSTAGAGGYGLTPAHFAGTFPEFALNTW